MTNDKREVALDINGKPYTFRFDLNAICNLENVLSTPTHDVTFKEAMGLIDRKSVGATRALLWAGLRKHHPTMTVEDAGDLMVEMGGIAGIEEKLSAAVKASIAPDETDQPAAQKRSRAKVMTTATV